VQHEPPVALHPTFREAFRFWLKLGFISFGGPTGQIAIMHAELVEKRKWISEARFLHALNYCMLLPGPEATQLATYIGWLLHKTWGGIVAGALFVLPSAFILWVLSYIYLTFGKVPAVEAVFYGLKPAVLAIVAVAVIRIGRRVLKNEVMWSLAAASFVAIFFLKAPFPLIVLTAASHDTGVHPEFCDRSRFARLRASLDPFEERVLGLSEIRLQVLIVNGPIDLFLSLFIRIRLALRAAARNWPESTC
jgi:chromate transporter